MTATARPRPPGGARGPPRRRCRPSALLALLALSCLSRPPLANAQLEDADDDPEGEDDDPTLGTIEVLLRFYDTTRGPEWKDRAGWLDPSVSNYCDWYGVTCYTRADGEERSGHIRALDLSDNKLRGVTPPDLYELPFLESLTLRDNPDLDVTMVGIEEASDLKDLVLSNTGTKSLSGVRRAASLQNLHVTDCDMGTVIPDDVYMLPNLRGLYANYAGFEGTVPTKLGQLRQLTELYLYQNDLTGTVPTELGSLGNLEVLALSQNAFRGTLPAELGKLSKLRILAVQREYGKERGEGISGPLPSFRDMYSLTEMYLENQRLNGTIPVDFLRNAPKGEVVKVDLMNNDLEGGVPPAMIEFERLTIFLTGNKITSIPAELCAKNGWMEGMVGNVISAGSSSPTSPSGCDAILCPLNTWNDYGRALPSDPCLGCSDSLPYMGSWECRNPDSPRTQSDVLKKFYSEMGGEDWNNDRGWTTDEDECTWHGIECSEGDRLVTSIDLQDNGLTGTPPPEIFGSLPKLNKLNLMANRLDFKFDGIDSAASLEYLFLSNTGLTSLRGIELIESLPLKELRISQNFLDGPVPPTIFKLTTLHYVSISHNKFTGTLPAEVGSLTQLVEFHAYGNRLTGQIPTTVGDMGPQLKMLVLAENDLGGTLPAQIDRLTGLETLSVHQTTKDGDGIKGPLPPYDNLKNLSVLHLNSNSLTGTLPPNLLLNSIKTNDEIEVNLAGNDFVSTIPSEWSRFTRLTLILNDNRITGIGDGICDVSGWMGGTVASYGCDAILCPKNRYNEFGRRTDASECASCSSASFAQFMGSTQCEERPDGGVDERDVLERFYYSTAGSEWDYNDGWTTSPDVCDGWFGISCDDEGRVTKIELASNSLTGTPHRDVFKLPYLRELDLQGNDIGFDFDGIGDAANLHTIYLSDTGISSLVGIGDAKSLRVLHSTSNNIDAIPDELYRVRTLERLFLNYNQISGRLSTKIGLLTNLEELYLMHNRMEGQIPAAIGELSQLRVLALTENDFDGTLPEELNSLRSMEVLAIQREGGVDDDGSAGGDDVGTNQRTRKEGGGISGPLLSFNDLPNLRELYLGSNSLAGSIPYDFLAGVDNKDGEVIVDLVSNQLTGTVPSALAQFRNMTLYVAGNEFEGIAPGLCKKENWMGGDVGSYGCDGLLCEPGTYSAYGRQNDDTNPCQSCTANSKAPYYGSFECMDTSDEYDSVAELLVLRNLYDAMGGPGWTLSTRWREDDDYCAWHGVQCVSETVRSVQGLRLPQNGLTGTLPKDVFVLPNLQELNLGGNKIAFTFDGIDKAAKLSYLNLDATGMTNLNGLRNAQTIKLLHIMGNDFGGTFPEDILFLAELEVLYLSDNDIGTTLTPSLETLDSLVYLQCFDCGLTGPVPTWFKNLPNLEYLRLDQNSLTGPLPGELADIPKLEHLDLSDQISRGGAGLTGNLPNLAGASVLSEVYLNKNNIEGPIPADFLSNVDTTLDIRIDLRTNKISGAIPSQLARIPQLSLYLSDNMIDQDIPAEICSMDFARGFGCDGVLCPPGKFASLGRQTDAQSACAICTAQGKAQYYGSTDCDTGNQRDILEKFYYDLRGGEWEVNDGWLMEDSPCDWYGVACSADGMFVTGIVLEDNGLTGAVPADIFQIPQLDTIKLKKNDITFPFDGIGNAQKLETLSLSEIGLTSIQGISEVKGSLKHLHLTNNNLGTIPEEIYDLINLEDLYMNYNNIESKVSTKIGLLTKLKNLFMFHNKITGTLPTELGNLRSLEVLALGENFMSGAIPTQLNQLTNVEIIALQREAGESAPGIGGPLDPKTPDEVGKGFTGLLPPFNGLPRIRELYLGSNSLSGEIPNEFLSAADKAAVIKVDLTMNELVGEVPDFLREFEAMKLYAAGNKFKDLSRSLCQKDKWMGGEVAVTGCNAILCPPDTFNAYGRAASTETPCEECPFTYKAEYYGSIQCVPSHTGQYTDREVLRIFYEATGGVNWIKSDNWMDDGESICQWHGVECDGGGDSVTKIDLASNNLSGTTPPVIFQLANLYQINLRDNPVDFEFHGIEGAASLTQLFLDSTKLTSLDGIGKAVKLETLHLQQNNFNGEPIPEEIFDLTQLRHLYLSDSLFGGSIPPAIQQLTQLEEFYCHGNEVTGTIPPEIAKLDNLEVLVLSENNIIGTIPTEMNSMVGLMSLFIDSFTRRNVGLSGPVPDFAGAANLREIYLNSNGLTGTVPADLLSGLTDKGQVITVGLRSNQITGTVPAELGRFSKLNIDLAGNQISGIDDALCNQGEWMSGLVGQFKCDAILCPPGTFNQHGRQFNAESDCIPCLGDGDDMNPYFGSLLCESEEKKKEKDILELLYNTCGGTKWKNQDNWMREDVDVCHWYGISCHESRLVDSILLGSNNLVGTPPRQIFEMTELKWLWLYANPIKFKFDGIGNAPKLTSLLLDSTTLDSLDGLEDASVLEDLDVRFNNLKGELPAGLNKLVNLKSFSCSENQLGGPLPSFTTMKKLERLRMGGNQFSGPLQDYATNARLKSLDLSGNAISGPIPPSFLKNADKSEEIYVDLSSNQLTGMVPGELDAFQKMTIYLRDNKITGIDPTLCDNDKWNDGDVGSFACDAILCPQGTFSPNDGRASRAGSQCTPCNKAQYFGGSYCGAVRSGGNAVRSGWLAGIVAMATALIICLMGFEM